MVVCRGGIPDQMIRKVTARLPRALEAVLVGAKLVQELEKFSGLYVEGIWL